MSEHLKNCENCFHALRFGCEQSFDEIDFERSIYNACVYGDIEKVKKFINQDRGWVNRQDKHGYTALHYAARNNFTHICKYLLENGADVYLKTKNCQSTALHRAAYMGNFEIVILLLNYNSNIFEKDSDSKTPFEKALEQYIKKNDVIYEKILKLLVEKDARIINESVRLNKPAIELNPEIRNWI